MESLRPASSGKVPMQKRDASPEEPSGYARFFSGPGNFPTSNPGFCLFFLIFMI